MVSMMQFNSASDLDLVTKLGEFRKLEVCYYPLLYL